MSTQLYLLAAYQKTQRIDPTDPGRKRSNNRFSNAIFHNVTVKINSAGIDDVRYPKDPMDITFTEKSF